MIETSDLKQETWDIMGKIATQLRCLVGGKDLSGFPVKQCSVDELSDVIKVLKQLLDQYDQNILDMSIRKEE